jgi:hypothetical protein
LEDLRQSLAFVPYCVEERSVKAQRIRGRSPRRLTRVSNEVCNSSAPRFCIYGYRPLAHMTWVDPSARRSHRRVQSFGEGPRPSLKDGVRGVKPMYHNMAWYSAVGHRGGRGRGSGGVVGERRSGIW